MGREATYFSVHCAGVGLHFFLGLSACLLLEPMGQNLMGPAAPSTGNDRSTTLFKTHILTSVNKNDNQSACYVISRWRMRPSLKDRLYIIFILIVCVGLPAFIIVTSYLVILLTVRT